MLSINYIYVHLQAFFACVVRFNGFSDNRARRVTFLIVLRLRRNRARHITRRQSKRSTNGC